MINKNLWEFNFSLEESLKHKEELLESNLKRDELRFLYNYDKERKI